MASSTAASRRTVLRTAAWGSPVLVTVAAAPFVAASVTFDLSVTGEPVVEIEPRPGYGFVSFTVRNNGPAAAPGPVSVLISGDGVYDAWSTPAGWTQTPTTGGVLWTYAGSMPVGYSAEISASVYPSGDTPTTVTAMIQPVPNETNGANNTATTQFGIKQRPDLTLELTTSATTVMAGVPVDYTATVQNLTTASTTNQVVVTVSKPRGPDYVVVPGTLSVVSSVGGSWVQVAEDADSITYEITGGVPGGAPRSAVLRFTPTAGAALPATVTFRAGTEPTYYDTSEYFDYLNYNDSDAFSLPSA